MFLKINLFPSAFKMHLLEVRCTFSLKYHKISGNNASSIFNFQMLWLFLHAQKVDLFGVGKGKHLSRHTCGLKLNKFYVNM